jgi:4-diphosphocytidyl-2-C-methyl-D-erythritol kinase
MIGDHPGPGSGDDPARRLSPVVRLAPAKVNLTLAVLGPRPDGYHDLHSVMVPVDVADRLSVALAPPHAGDSLHVSGRDAGPVADNLVLRAIRAARQGARSAWSGPGEPPPLAARLEKRIPVAAGLGGGSSDAAAAIGAATEAWGVDLDPAAMRAVAASVGSDVPFFLAGGPALVEGRGERVTPLPWVRDATDAFDRPALLLVTPSLAVPTPAVFAAHAAGARVAGGIARLASEHLASELRSGLTVGALLARASVLASANDLAPATIAVAPDLLPFARALRRLVGRPVALSGSGPTHWALYASLDEALRAADEVRDAVSAGTIPVPGDGPPFVAAARIMRHAGRDR